MLGWVLIGAALAQSFDPLEAVAPEVDAHLFQLSIDSDTGFWTNDAGTVLDRPMVRGRLGAHYAYRPFVVAYDPEDALGRSVEVLGIVQAEVNQVVHINRFRFGLDIPLYIEGFAPVPLDLTLSEIGLDGRVTILDPYRRTVGLGFGLHSGLPTVMTERTLPGTARRRYLEPEVAVEVRRGDLSVAANLSYRWISGERSPGVAWGDQTVWRFGAGYTLLQGDAHLSVETLGAALFRNPQVIEEGWRGLPVQQELVAGGWYRLKGDVFVESFVGSSPLKSLAAPSLRVYLGIAAHPNRDAYKDMDGDGFSDLVDRCDDEPEDFDDWEDMDGCPEPDNDGDGLLDADDQCPLEPEDLDDWVDEDGCPDPDNDRDRIPDELDECPNDREDRDRYQDEDGCPDPSSRVVVEVADPVGNFLGAAEVRVRGNGMAFDGAAGAVFDLHDAAYTISASLPEYRSAELTVHIDGTAEPRKFITLTLEPVLRTGSVRVRVVDPEGNALDGATVSITDTEVTGETVGGVARLADVPEGAVEVEVRASGYGVAKVPAEIVWRRTAELEVQLVPMRAILLAGRIEIRDSVYFETGSATIRDISFPLLDDVSAIILDNPRAELVQVEGHTDSRGSDSFNKDLSQRRAASVRQYLIDAGVEADRLIARGFGEEFPIDPREVPEAWDRNRRVDFYIARWAGEEIDVDAEREKVRREAMGEGEQTAPDADPATAPGPDAPEPSPEPSPE